MNASIDGMMSQRLRLCAASLLFRKSGRHEYSYVFPPYPHLGLHDFLVWTTLTHDNGLWQGLYCMEIFYIQYLVESDIYALNVQYPQNFAYPYRGMGRRLQYAQTIEELFASYGRKLHYGR